MTDTFAAMLDKLSHSFQYLFVWYALAVGALIALCSSLLGVTLVLKRFSFIGDGLSHVAFGALAIAAAVKLTDNFILILPVTIISAVLLLRTGQKTRIKGDASVAMISVGSLAVGYLIMTACVKKSNLAGDVCTTLFGTTSILTLTKTQVWLCATLSFAVIVVFVLFYNKIFAVTFDEDFSTATGVNAKIYNLIFAVVIAVVIVVAMNLVGALLISALVIFPALSVMRVFRSFKAVTVSSVIVSVAFAVLGILISIVTGFPVGSTIVAVNIVGFFAFSLVGAIMRIKN